VEFQMKSGFPDPCISALAALLACLCAAGTAAPAPAAVARLAAGQSCVPAWPDTSIGKGESGTTRLLLRVDPEGIVTSAKITASSGFADLDRATVVTATRCRFAPGARSGGPGHAPVVFSHVWERGVTGGDAVGASRPAARLPCAKLPYPADALRDGEQGTVHMRFLIDTDGAVLEKSVVKSSGFPALDGATLDGMAGCRFSPALANGKPERSLLSFSYTWTLN
jgi:TonB family protein